MYTTRFFITVFTLTIALALAPGIQAQVVDIFEFDATSEGPWSDIDNTTLTVPKVGDGSVNLNGDITSTEYGGFEGVTVVPADNGWILDYPGDREWDGPEDSSFTFWLAHDNDYLYVGVVGVDDIVNIDQPPATAWRDDAIEIVIDAMNDDYDVNTDNSQDEYGGHIYATYEGGFSEWDDAAQAPATGLRFSSVVDWKLGEDQDVFVVGKEEAPGWKLELKMSKRLFENPEVGNKLDDGYEMGFNIGVDDDDMHYEGGDGFTMEVQYFWANRMRPMGYDPAVLVWDIAESGTAWYDTMEQMIEEMEANPTFLQDNFDWGINSAGRLSHGGAGSIIFAAGTAVSDWSLY